MKLTIRKVTIDSFRGVRHREIEFNGDSKIKGCNGSGKSTIMSAVLWVLADVDSKLTKNPDVIPIGESECSPTVEIELELDGKPLNVCKTQKYKQKEVDGKITSSITNSYSINGIDKSLKAFTEDLSERGIDMNNFLYLSHPDAFTSDVSAKGREKIREILFGMIDSLSDVEIAKGLNVPELYALLDEKGYKVEEVDSMAKASLRKINERYGKNNEILDGRISGIIQSKAEVDVKSLEKQKADYESELEQVRSDFLNLRNADNDIKEKIARLEGDCIDLESKCQHEADNKVDSASEKLRKYESKRHEAEIKMINAKAELDRILAEKTGIKESLDTYRDLYKKVQNEVFDESSTVCPSCKRPFEKSEVDRIRKDFGDGKVKRLADYKSKGETFSKKLTDLEDKYKSADEEYKKADSEWKKADAKVDKYAEELRVLPRRPNMNENEDYIKLREQIQALKDSLGQTDAFKIQELSNRESYLIQVIKQTVGEIALADRNKELDKQIEDLRQEKKDAEIQRAANEKLISQVKDFTQAKNDLLTNEINKKFSMIDWHLYEYQKNGDIKPVCEPYIDGKPMTSAANGSLITLAKISICADLQKHFNQTMPIWVEDYSLFSSNTESRLNVESQVIGLVVTEDKELRVEHE